MRRMHLHPVPPRLPRHRRPRPELAHHPHHIHFIQRPRRAPREAADPGLRPGREWGGGRAERGDPGGAAGEAEGLAAGVIELEEGGGAALNW